MKNWVWQALIFAVALLVTIHSGFPFGGAPARPQKCVLTLPPNATSRGESKAFSGYGRDTAEAQQDAIGNCRIEMDVLDPKVCKEAAENKDSNHPNLVCGDTPVVTPPNTRPANT